MITTPILPATNSEIDEDTKAILTERLKTVDEDAAASVDARKALASLLDSLKPPAPR
jgi:hypothetical protein